ncbi:MAG TPA: hypothetical protein VGT81_09035 [Casimicrobiaceae bacterium]|nr:hypothetical protein [Casimicrobiaceae bacterium]
MGMTHDLPLPRFHLAGDQPPVEESGPPQGVSLDSFAGPVHVEWDTGAALTPLGQLPFFIDFLKAACSMRSWWIARFVTRAQTRRKNAMCWERQCCRCCLGKSVMLISQRCVAIAFFQSFSA